MSVSAFIQRINKIKNFGSFEDFSWPSTLSDFKKSNLFYGKNGSGKTTLSQLLQCYEDGAFPEDFIPVPSAEISTEKGKSSDLSLFLGRIKVFNTYYINSNLFWDGGHATNLLWLGKADIKIQEAIAKLDEELEELEKAVPNLSQTAKDASDKVEALLTNHSKIIRNSLSYDQAKYQKTHLKRDYSDIISGKIEANVLTDEEYRNKLTVANANSAELEITNYGTPKLNLKEIGDSVITLLSEKITPTVKIEELMQNCTNLIAQK